MRYRLLALDVDGTLLDSSHRLRPRVISAIHAAHVAGLTITLATGKLFGSILPLLATLGISGPQIVLNGAATLDSSLLSVAPSAAHPIPSAPTLDPVIGAPLRFAPLGEPQRRAILAAVRAADPGVLVSHFALDGIYMDEAHPDASIFAEYGEGPPLIVPNLASTPIPPAAKILIAGEPERLVQLRERVTPQLASSVTITTTTPDFLEFFHLDAGKGSALVALQRALNITRTHTVAIGDGENDIPLLREAGLAIAMANGSPATRAIANRIAPSNDDDGVAVILEELLRA